MTEEEWEGIRWFDNAYSVLAENPQEYDRKLRLLTCACLRANWFHIPDENARAVVDESERYADDPSRIGLLRAAVEIYSGAVWDDPSGIAIVAAAVYSASYRDTANKYHTAIERLILQRTRQRGPFEKSYEFVECRWHQQFAFLNLLRDIFGNPFRPVAFDPNWRTATAVGLAQTMYDARDFHAMPILADALQDAGCEDAAILGHCRDAAGVHVRGCWVVDRVLGKS